MARTTNWWLTLGVALALGGAARADELKSPPRDSNNPRSISDLADPADRKIEEALHAPVTFNYRDTPLSEVIDDLHRQTKLNVVPNVLTLEEAGILLDFPLSLAVD